MKPILGTNQIVVKTSKKKARDSLLHLMLSCTSTSKTMPPPETKSNKLTRLKSNVPYLVTYVSSFKHDKCAFNLNHQDLVH
ncbi:hypothetical protein CDL12_05350 [Handroanthus impetiginosus]|uniref:Uncharacterized protein n=1 Tax=Handroanthus impetiginosus TaxID=429701 RepID=A0A2G9HWN8_9LAMI|nr:hypothetical protein CDL12_05350 [Handroanthus impetiginosus]